MDKNRLKKNLQRLLLILASLFIIIIFALTIFTWQLKSGNLLQLSSGQIMTRSQYLKTYPPEGTIFESKNTPAEVYAEFYQLIMANDYEKAVLLIDDGDKNRPGRYLEAFRVEGEFFKEWKAKLPQEIKQEEIIVDGNNGYYPWYWTENEDRSIGFRKGIDGFWKIIEI